MENIKFIVHILVRTAFARELISLWNQYISHSAKSLVRSKLSYTL